MREKFKGCIYGEPFIWLVIISMEDKQLLI